MDMDSFNVVPSPGSVEAMLDNMSGPSTPLQAPPSVPSLPGTPMVVYTPGGSGGGGGIIDITASPISAQPPTPIMVGGGGGMMMDVADIKQEMPPPNATPFQFDASLPGASGAGGATPTAAGYSGGFGGAAGGGGGAGAGPNESGEEGGAAGETTENAGFALSDLLMQLEEYTPTIPDSVANHFLHQAGFETVDPRMARLLALAAQKFVSDLANEAFTHCKLKGQANQPPNAKGKPIKDKKYSLTMEDLVPVLNDHGITVKKPPYYT